jgi:hypothetical protein
VLTGEQQRQNFWIESRKQRKGENVPELLHCHLITHVVANNKHGSWGFCIVSYTMFSWTVRCIAQERQALLQEIEANSEIGKPPLWSSGQSSWLHNGDVLCFL